jgi:hypothetical protein
MTNMAAISALYLSAGILPAVLGVGSRVEELVPSYGRGGRGRPPDRRRDGGATVEFRYVEFRYEDGGIALQLERN